MKSDKRIILAIVLSSVILLGYPSFMNKFFPGAIAPTVTTTTDSSTDTITKDNPLVVDAGTTPVATQKNLEPIIETMRPPAESSTAPAIEISEEFTTVKTPLYTAVFTNIGAGIKSFKLNDYDKSAVITDEGVGVDIAKSYGRKNHLSNRINIGGRLIEPAFKASTDDLELKEGDKKELLFKWRSANGLQIEKLYTFTSDDYTIETETRIVNETSGVVTGMVETELTRAFEHEKKVYYHKGAIRMVGDEVERHDVDDQELSGKDSVSWLGIEEKYFITAIFPKPVTDGAAIDWTMGVPAEDTARVLISEPFTVGYNSEETYKSEIFIGPKEYDNLKAKGYGFEEAIEFGFFSFMAKPALVILNFLQGFIVNYGIAIILLTLIIKIVFHPLTKHGLKSMKEMQKVQPQMKAIKERYKDDKQKMNKEIMSLYKRYNVNPIGGCLPMLIQIPVFIALYEVLYVAIELRHAPFFLWITDLSAKDPYYIMPVLMGISMFVQQKMTPSAMDAMQAKMMMIMPVVLTFLFLQFPSGLVLYWLTNNLLSIVQQYHIYREGSSGSGHPPVDVKAMKAKS